MTRRPALPLPGPRTVDVWWVDLDAAGALPALRALLSPDERERAARFHFARDHDRWVVARGALRSVLARYLGIAAEAIRFGAGPQGKPYLAEVAADTPLRFNLSHAGGVGVVAVTRGREVGVDVEVIQPRNAEPAIARHFFAPAEVAELQAERAETDRVAAFFRCWTRKEAYIKARGGGLSIPLDGFQVSLDVADARLLWVAGEAAEVARWSMAVLAAPPGYEGALVVEGEGAEVEQRWWPAPAG